MQKNKKGVQLNMAVGAIVTLVLLATLIIVAIYLFSSLEASTNAPGTVGSAINESTSAVVNEKGINLSAYNLRDVVCSMGLVTNSTDGALIGATNYTITNCQIASTATSVFNNTIWNVSYSYTYTASTSASNASDSMITNFSTYPALVGLVGTIIFLGIVIGVLVASFVFGRKEEA